MSPEQAPDVAYFDDPREFDQGFSSFPTHVAIGTPTDTGTCEVEIEFCFEPPSLKTAVQTVCFPLKVEAPGKLFLRSVGVDNSDNYFAVAPGEYDVVARFLKKRASREDAGCRPRERYYKQHEQALSRVDRGPDATPHFPSKDDRQRLIGSGEPFLFGSLDVESKNIRDLRRLC